MTTDLNQANKRLVWNHWKALESVADEDLHQVMSDAVDAGLLFHGPDPINDLHGAEAFLAELLAASAALVFRPQAPQPHVFRRRLQRPRRRPR